MDTDSPSPAKPNNTICLRRKRLEKSRQALTRHSVVPTVLENREDERKEKLTSLVGKIRYAQNRAQKPPHSPQLLNDSDDKPLWEVD